jgi:hypothetical protein
VIGKSRNYEQSSKILCTQFDSVAKRQDGEEQTFRPENSTSHKLDFSECGLDTTLDWEAERGERSIGNSQAVVCNHRSCFGSAILLIIRVRGA